MPVTQQSLTTPRSDQPRLQNRLCTRIRSTQASSACAAQNTSPGRPAPPPHTARTDAYAPAYSAPPESRAQMTTRHSVLPAPRLYLPSVWRTALSTSQSLPLVRAARTDSQKVACSLRRYPHPLPLWRKHILPHARSRIHQSQCVLACTMLAYHARIRYQNLLTALLAACPRKPLHQNVSLRVQPWCTSKADPSLAAGLSGVNPTRKKWLVLTIAAAVFIAHSLQNYPAAAGNVADSALGG